MAVANPFATAPIRSTSPQAMPSMTFNSSGEARIKYFIARNDGVPVPLIPADELPIALESVPRMLPHAQAYGMNYCGPAGNAGPTFKLANAASGMQRSISQPGGDAGHSRFYSADNGRHFQAPDSLARQAFANNTTASSTPQRPLSASQAALSWRNREPLTTSNNSASETTLNTINAILRSEAGAETAERIGYRPRDTTPPPSGIIPDQEKKVYCTHWILHGWCGFAQQGCRYKHEMPDKAKLAEIGIKHVPTWWKEENATFRAPGRAATAGPIIPPEEWLNARKGSDADSESSSTTEATCESDRPVSVLKKAPVEKEVADTPTPTKTTRTRPVEESAKKSSAGSSPIIPPARPSSPAEEARKMSASSDLIKFAPLLPTQASPNTPPNATEPRKRITPDTITSKARELSSTKSSSPPSCTEKTMKVFVPAGESPEIHVADAKKRERAAARNKGSRTPSPVQQSEVKSFDKQAKEMQKGKAESPTPARGGSGTVMAGLSPEEKAKRSKFGCRIRRPATSSSASKAKAAEAKATEPAEKK
ncbi:hypothetical protein PRZ48_004774 [Zasmidium cellare]|uniref:C3H1-type domain-containing protein n=1 Tax=Zasmidium cellare TaxID=395010 RepID=A0ABR0EQJ5_ZASCE|nr:hypothetical protein PRZ48_004774 [Zasmidium cellare]